VAGLGKDAGAWRGLARLGKAWPGKARQGAARRGKDAVAESVDVALDMID